MKTAIDKDESEFDRMKRQAQEWLDKDRNHSASQFTTQRQVTDEEIRAWSFEYVKDVYNNLLPNEGDSMPFDSGDFKLWLNLMVEAAKAMRDNKIGK